MKLARLRRTRMMARLALVLVLALLFQQAAVAAYACQLDSVPATALADMPDCSGMTKLDPAALCDQHCHPDQSTLAMPHAVSVPPAVLPPMRFEPVRILVTGLALHRWEDIPPARSDPSPLLLFCSLLI